MKDIILKFHQCEFCGLVYRQEQDMNDHEEKECVLNPKNRSCPTCKEAYIGWGRGDCRVAKCKKDELAVEIRNCPDWIQAGDVNQDMLDEYSATNSESVSTYLPAFLR